MSTLNATRCFDAINHLNAPICQATGRSLAFSKMWQEESYTRVCIEYFFDDDSSISVVLTGARVLNPELFKRYLIHKLLKLRR